MSPDRWEKLLNSLDYPPSYTSQDQRRRVEADYFVTFATHEWDTEKSLLVVGCGDGYEVKLLLEKGWKDVIGITWHPKEFEESQKMGLGEHVIQGDFHDMGLLQDSQFDYVISKETLEHALSPFAALVEINRVMKVGGSYVFYIPEGPAKQSDWYHLYCAPDWLWKDIIDKAGFSVDSITRQIDQNKFSGTKLHSYYGDS